MTSNVQTRTAASHAEHPLKVLLRHGVVAVITTDNRTASATTLPHELAHAAPAAGLSPEDIANAERSAAQHAFN